MRLVYDDATLDAVLVQGDGEITADNRDRAICFDYESGSGSVEIKKKPCETMNTGRQSSSASNTLDRSRLKLGSRGEDHPADLSEMTADIYPSSLQIIVSTVA